MTEADNTTTTEARTSKGTRPRAGGKRAEVKRQTMPKGGRIPATWRLPLPAAASAVTAVAAEIAARGLVAGAAWDAWARVGEPKDGPFSEAMHAAHAGTDAAVTRLASLPAVDLHDLAVKAAWVARSFMDHEGGEAEQELAASVLGDLKQLAPEALFWLRSVDDEGKGQRAATALPGQPSWPFLPTPPRASSVAAIAGEIAARGLVAGAACDVWMRVGEPKDGPFSEALRAAHTAQDAAVTRLASLPAVDLHDLAVKAAWVTHSLLYGGGDAEEELAESVLRDLKKLAPKALFWRRDVGGS